MDEFIKSELLQPTPPQIATDEEFEQGTSTTLVSSVKQVNKATSSLSLLNNYTTNRILEIPQDIKWRIDLVETDKKRYRLTVLQGSIYYVPQGFEADGVTRKFTERTMNNDNTCADIFWSDNASSEEFVFLYFKDNTAILSSSARAGSNITSGDTAPTTFLEQRALWYDTKNNYVKYTEDSGATWYNCSLPFLKGSPRNTIDETHPIAGWVNGPTQVFNGFGYIGSTIFGLPGIKCLVGNGRNPDGSVITEIVKTTKCSTLTNTFGRIDSKIVIYDGIIGMRAALWFDEQLNICINNGSGTYLYQPTAILGSFSTETTSPWNITEFNPLGVDSLVNSNASNFSKAGESYLSSLGMPSDKYIYLTLGASGTKYTAPANGYFNFRGRLTSPRQFVYIGDVTYDRTGFQCSGVEAGDWIAFTLPVAKNSTIIINYNTGADNTLRFIYAQGEV